MRRSVQLTVCGCAAALALAFTAMAAASYQPAMGIFQQTYVPGGSKPVTIVVGQEAADDPTARIVIYAPPGYTATLTQAPGTTIGQVTADVKILDLSTNTFTLKGPVKADNPANYPAASNPCTPGVAHEAVWTLNAAVAGQPANPMPVNVAGSAPSGVQLVLFAGVKGRNGIGFKAVAKTKTRKGKYVFNRRLPKKVTYLLVERPPTGAACALPLAPCTLAIVSNTISKVIKVSPARRRR